MSASTMLGLSPVASDTSQKTTRPMTQLPARTAHGTQAARRPVVSERCSSVVMDAGVTVAVISSLLRTPCGG